MRVSVALAFLLSLSTLSPAFVRAADDDLTQSASSEPASLVPAGARASIVVVGGESAHAELTALLDELLQRQAIASEFSQASHFDPDALFLTTEDDARVLVFVVVEPSSAKLYLRGPRGQRFLLRKLVLPSGLDAVGQELIGHVVESATLALLRSTQGLSREEASAEITRARGDADGTSPVRAQAAPTPQRKPEKRRAPAPATPSHARPASGFELALGARYAAIWSGPALGFSQGPGAELSAAYRTNAAWLVRVRVLGERHFTQTLAAPELEARVRSAPFRGGVDFGVVPSAPHQFFLGAAAGADLVHVTPGPRFANDVALRASTTRTVPMLRFELRYELVFGHVIFAAAGFADASLVRTRYELVESGTRRTLATPLTLRPGATLAVAFSPSTWLAP